MTVREGGPPGGLLRWLLFDDINHPRYAKFIGDFAKAMRPESFLPGPDESPNDFYQNH